MDLVGQKTGEFLEVKNECATTRAKLSETRTRLKNHCQNHGCSNATRTNQITNETRVLTSERRSVIGVTKRGKEPKSAESEARIRESLGTHTF